MGLQFHPVANPATTLTSDNASPRAHKRIQHDVTDPAAVFNGSLHQRHRFGRWVERNGSGLVKTPDVALVPVTAPVVLVPFPPAVEDRLVLALVIGSAQGEGTLGPDDELGPVTSSVDEGPLLGVQFRAGHEDVYRAVGVGQHVLAGYEQKVVKAVPQSIVLDRSSSTGI